MRRHHAVLLLFLLLSPAAAVDDLLMKGRVLVLGDSITHAGGWVTCLVQQLARHHGKLPDVVAIGLASETASGLSEQDHPFPRPCVHERLGRALERVKPQVVVACYGMNDGIYWPLDDARLQAFQKGIGKLITDCQAAGAQVLVLTPPPFDPQPVRAKLRPAGAADYGFKAPFDGYGGVLEAFARWELTLPAAQARVVDLNGPMTAYLAKRRVNEPAFAFSGDGIHPNDQGLLLMADCVLRELGYPGVGDDLATAFTSISADPLYPQIKKWREQRSNGWRDFVGYTREKTVTRAAIDDVEEQATALKQGIEAALGAKR
jgi:lysophospholipase L1-like esterase